MYRYIICFDGPDAGKGWVILSNGNNRAALVNAEIAQRLILHARWYASQRSESRVARCGTCGRWARGRMVFLDGCRDSVGRGHAGSWAGAMPGHGPAKVCPQH